MGGWGGPIFFKISDPKQNDISKEEEEQVFIVKTKGRFGQHRLSLHPKYNDADDFITNVWNDKEVCHLDKVSDKYKKWYHFFW